tara:strand:- start:25602 stop:29039 length:3438 start_codon:yes stop_codon:yes gene_type:complete
MVQRVVLGKAAANTTNPYYHRSNEFGLFVSKPGANVHNCPDGDLIFDSTLPSLMQPIARGSATVPKATYAKGFFGEAGVINDSNWDSAGTEPTELNSDTSWAFSAFAKVASEVADMKKNTTGDMESYIEWTGGAFLQELLEPDVFLESQRFERFNEFNNDYFRYDPFRRTIKNFPDFSSEEFVRSAIKDIWRIYDVFPFLNDGHVFGEDFNPGGGIDTSAWHNHVSSVLNESASSQEEGYYLVNDAGVTYQAIGLIYEANEIYDPLFPDVLKPLIASKISELTGGDLTSSSDYPFYYNHWKGLFNSANQSEIKYDKIGYNSSSNPIPNGFPMVWRAWTTPESGPYSLQQERAAIKKFYTYMFIFGWMKHTFANQVHSGNILDYTLIDSDEYGYLFDFGNSSFPRYVNQFSVQTPCASRNTSFEQYNTYNNSFEYSQWTDGFVKVNTGAIAPSGIPVQVWWNTILKGAANTTTNLTFLNDSRNRIKTTEETKREYVLVPNITSVHANTFVESGLVQIRFSQPSTLDETQLFYTLYKEPAWIGNQVVAASAVTETSPDSPLIPVQFAQHIILDVRDLADGGDNRAGRKADDGRYYTIVFPDDFIGTRNTITDPFSNYRDSSGRIDQPLAITLSVAEGVVISGNSFHNHITSDQLRTGTKYRGDVPFGPVDSAGRATTEIFAANDPCIKLNLHSNEFTDDGIAGLTVMIENRGTIIGAGGWGSYGQMNIEGDKYQDNYPGGGGGGGQGYHPTLTTENQDNWLGSHTDLPTPIDGAINTPEEIASVTTAVSTHWDGPTNYVEWGIGGNGGGFDSIDGVFVPNPFSANTQYTGFDYITWKSIGPGKPGTGYLGATTNFITTQPTGFPIYDYPYGKDPLVPDGQGRLVGQENIYERIAGTYFTGTGEARFNPAGWGRNGMPGTTTAPGSGGAESITTTFGYNQDPVARIRYDDPNDEIGEVNVGRPSSGSGGSCVYVFANTESQIIGTQVRLINMETGIVKSGGGGGSGGASNPGLGGGKLGRPGSYSSDVVISTSYIANQSEQNWGNYSRRGEPGKLIWWNAENVVNNYMIENRSTRNDGAIEGIDYNSQIGGEDYVSYAPNVTLSGGTSTEGVVYWSRRLVNGDVLYDGMLERTYEEYINSSDTPEDFE